ncbi:MAG: hypothetical protein JST22_15980 [Bacteroidetes bacterium]|nr:hypothetical protein [Bacteroidota bacterium]
MSLGFSMQPARGFVPVLAALLCWLLPGSGLLMAQGAAREDSARAVNIRQERYDSSVARPKIPGFEEDVLGREEWFMFQRRYPFDVVPAGALASAIRAIQGMQSQLDESRAKGDRQAHLLAASTWEAIGPVNIGGRIQAIAQHPTKQGVIFIGAASGGVWKSTDDGATWNTTFDKQASISIGAIAIDRTDPNIIYVGSGEPNTPSATYFGHGVFKSTDEGATWTNIGLETVGGFSKIYVHRQNHQIVYATGVISNQSDGGFYRSVDGGATWTRTMSGTVYDLSVNPANCEELFIATASAISYSTDGGRSFTKRVNGINVAIAYRISVAMAPSDPNHVYALVAGRPGSAGLDDSKFYASTDRGTTWTMREQFSGQFFRDQGWYDNAVVVHPDSPLVVLAAGIDAFRTEDGGDHFINYTDAYANLGDPNAVHADQHVMEFDPKDRTRLLLGNDGGLFRSENNGIQWSKIGVKLPITQFYKMDVDANNVNLVYGGAQDNGSSGYLGTHSNALQWDNLSGGDGFYVAADPFRPGIVFTEIYYGQPVYKVDISQPGFALPISDYIDNTAGDKGDWSTPMAIGLSDGRFYSGRHYLWRTSDDGGSWEQLRPGTGGLISAIGVSPYGGKLMVGSNIGDARFSVDDGHTWAAAKGLPRRTVSDIRYDFTAESRVFITLSGTGSHHVFQSDDDGANFADISANLPDVTVNTIAVDPQNNQHLFIGTDAGAFVSLNGGKFWYPFNDGLPLAPVVDLKINDQARTLIAATHGRSMFRINIAKLEIQPTVIRPVSRSTYETPGPVTMQWYGLTGPVRVSISYDGGANFSELASGVVGDSLVAMLPLARTANARVKVEEQGTGNTAVSSDFTLTPHANGSGFASKGFVAEAIEWRRGTIWATARGTDSIYTLRTPLLGGLLGHLRTGITGHVRDMAYDSVADRFYLLVADDDFGHPRIFPMDTDCVGGAEIVLPAEIAHASGIAMTSEGLAVITPGATAQVYILGDSGAIRRTTHTFDAPAENQRISLAWDGQLVQAVTLASPGTVFPSRLERVRLADTLQLIEAVPAIVGSGQRIDFAGLAVDNSNPSQIVYWATDTNGIFYKFTQLFSGVREPNGSWSVSGALRLGNVTPNPLRSAAVVDVTASSNGAASLDLYRADGSLVRHLFDGMLEAGSRGMQLDLGDVASGVYYLVVSDARGNRDARSVVVVR